MNKESGTRTEYGVRSTWPDGHVEFDWDRHDRGSAEAMVRGLKLRSDRDEIDEEREAVRRVVTVSEWMPIPVLMAGQPPASAGEIRLEWGVRRTWPDGHSEVRTHSPMLGNKPYDRHMAETAADNAELDRARRRTEVTAEAVGRLILTSGWELVPVPTAEADSDHDPAVITATVLFGTAGFEDRP